MKKSIQRAIKKIFDFLMALIGLIILSPFFVIIAFLIVIDSKGPVFFKDKRCGRDGKIFTPYKFRTMIENAMDVGLGVEIARGDLRITKIGVFLRRWSLDEIPQLINVFKGEMTLVGPRPLPTEEAAQCSDWESQRLAVKPGITCIWQVSGRSELDFDTWVQMDIEYIEEWSLWFDLKLLARTIPAVRSGRGAY